MSRLLSAVFSVAVLLAFPASRALAMPAFFDQQCASCHLSPDWGGTCNGCHAHGSHSDATKSDINIRGVTNKTTYAAGETVTVSMTGGYQSGWVRTVLVDQAGVELARTTGPSSRGGGPALPVTLSGVAPATPGMYAWQVRLFGNAYDSATGVFGSPGTWIPDWQPNHGYQTGTMNAFFVGSVPKLALAPAALDFGSLLTGSNKSITTSIQSAGNATLTVSSVAPCAGTSAAFTTTPAPPFTIPAGSSQTLTVRYAPTAVATDAGCIALTSNDLAVAVTNLAVTGTATAAAQRLIAVAPNPVSFGTVTVGGTLTKTVAVTNPGSGALTVSSIAACPGAAFNFAWTPAGPFTVAAGATQNVVVTYTPNSTWIDDNCLTVASDAANAASVTLSMQARGYVAAAGSCTACHGDAARVPASLAPAPPVDTKGNSLPVFAGVGAHQSHLTSTRITGVPVSCTDCHATPTGAHPSGTTEFSFSPLARTGALNPSYDFVTSTCASTYCHGATLLGGTNKAPKWTQLDGTQAACGTCHGVPPPAPHTASTACASCHGGYTSTTVNAGLHINGLVDVVTQSCTSCHGTAGRVANAGIAGAVDANLASAPPIDAAGSATGITVGDHQTHLNPTTASQIFRPLACTDCHPDNSANTGHANAVVDVTLATVATFPGSVVKSAGTTPATCTTYCHGSKWPAGDAHKGARASWAWNGAAAACGDCHSDPPTSAAHNGFTAATNCGTCHTGYTATTVNQALHINGVADVLTQTCTTCHGTAGRAGGTGASGTNPVASAPPLDTLANTATTARGVGAHLAHLTGTRFSATPVACAECHAVPTSTTHSNGVRDLAFGTLTRTGGLVPAFNTTAFTCSNTWCHGGSPSLLGGTVTAPVWTTVNGTQAACGTCHGQPPPEPHVQNATCGKCHTGFSQTVVNAALHLNGVVDVVPLTCASCHGTAARTGGTGLTGTNPVASAPPADTLGGSATTARGVGAHLAHLAGTTLSNTSVACSECHIVPTVNTHNNGTSLVTFGAVSKTGGVTPLYNTTTLTCAATYCHGGSSTILGGTNKTPVWTTVNGTQAACGTCHGLPPPAPHVQNATCGNCHTGYTASTVNKALHLNLVVDFVAQTCTSCHGTAGRVANTGLTGTVDVNLASAPPLDASGSGTSVKVGDHVSHLNPTAGAQLYRPLACTDCHPNNAGNTGHSNAVLDVTLATIATFPGTVVKSVGTTPATCTTYCHGSKWPAGDAHKGARASWAWNGANAACGDCHADPPTSAAHSGFTAATNCGTCHTGYTATTVNQALHINGATDVVAGGEPLAGGSSCGGCHATIFNGMTGTVAKVSKHTLGGGDVPTPGTTAWTTATTLKGSPNYANANCVSMCHGDHPHDITGVTTHQNNVYLDANARSATRDATTRSSKDFDAAAANGGLCVSCHQLPVDAAHPAVGKTTFAGTAHDFTSKAVGTATYTWQYTLHDGGVYQRDCTKCHASQAEGRSPTVAANGSGTVGPHSSDFGSLLAGETNPGATAANLVCYNCHGNGTTGLNMSGKDLATAISRSAATSGGSHKRVNTDTLHATSSEAATTWNSGAFSGTRRHVNCIDCHDEHFARTGLVARTATATSTRNALPPAMAGATGLTYSTFPALPTAACASGATLPNACFTQTTAASFSATPVAATLEYQVCFKCHSSFAFGNTTFPTATGASGLQETDVAAEFSPTNKSGHPVVTGLASYTGNTAPKALVAAQLLAPWNTNVGTQTMLCSDCHNTDAASPAAQGPHGSAITYMLAGANRAWPYNVAGATSGTLIKLSTSETNLNNANGNGLFCRNCHPQMNNTASNSVHRNTNLNGGQHGGNANVPACTGCHIRVPHGGKLSRLFVTTNAPARYKIGTPNMAQVSKNATKDGYGTGWPTGFRSSCSQHSGSGTGTELW